MPLVKFAGFSYAQSLDLSYDGRIPAELKVAAEKIDATDEAKRTLREERGAIVRLTNVKPSDGTAIALMIRTIFDRAPAGLITREDFTRIGLPQAQVDRLAETACARAVALDPRIGELLQQAA